MYGESRYSRPRKAIALCYASILDCRASWESQRTRKAKLTVFTALVATFGYVDVKEIDIVWGDGSVGKIFVLQSWGSKFKSLGPI